MLSAVSLTVQRLLAQQPGPLGGFGDRCCRVTEDLPKVYRSFEPTALAISSPRAAPPRARGFESHPALQGLHADANSPLRGGLLFLT